MKKTTKRLNVRTEMVRELSDVTLHRVQGASGLGSHRCVSRDIACDPPIVGGTEGA